MAQQPLPLNYDDFLSDLNPPQPEQSPGFRRVISDLVRAAAERPGAVAAGLARVGSGALSFPGGYIGAGISGAGETLAQMIENKSTDLSKLHKGRIAVEAGIGAIPFAQTIKAGKITASALKSGAIATAGTAGRKAADAVEERSWEPLKPKNLSPWDALPTVLGAGIGGIAGKATRATAPIVDTSAKVVPTLQTGPGTGTLPIKGGKIPVARIDNKPIAPIKSSGTPIAIAPQSSKWSPDKIEELAKKYEAAGKQDLADEIRKKGTPVATSRIPYAGEEPLTPGATRDAARIKKETEKAALEARNSGRILDIRNGMVPTGRSSSDSYRAPGADGGTESASIRYGVPKEDGADAGGAAPDLSRRPNSLESSGRAVMSADRAKHLLRYDPEIAVERGVLIKDGDGYLINPNWNKKPMTKATAKAAGAPATKTAAPAGPAPIPGVFQIVKADGSIAHAADAESAAILVNASGQGSRVIPPSDLPASAKPATTPKAAAPVTEQSGTAGARDWAANPPRTPAEVAEYTASKAGAKVATEAPPAAADAPIEVIAPDEVGVTLRGPASTPAEPPVIPGKGGVAVEEPPVPRGAAPIADTSRFVVGPKGTAIDVDPPTGPVKAGGYTAPKPDVPPVKPEAAPAAAPESTTGTAPPPAAAPTPGTPPSRSGRPPVSKDLDTRTQAYKVAKEAAVLDGSIKNPEVAKAFNLLGASLKKEHAAEQVAIREAAKAAAPPVEPPTTAPPPTPDAPVAADPTIDIAPTGDRLQNPNTTAKPVSPQLQMRMETIKNQMAILKNAGKGDGPEMAALQKELEGLGIERFIAEYPDLANELVQMQQAAKAAPKPPSTPDAPPAAPAPAAPTKAAARKDAVAARRAATAEKKAAADAAKAAAKAESPVEPTNLSNNVTDTSQMSEEAMKAHFKKTAPAEDLAAFVRGDMSDALRTRASAMKNPTKTQMGDLRAAWRAEKQTAELASGKPGIGSPKWKEALDAETPPPIDPPTPSSGGPKISANPMFDPEAYKWAGQSLGAEGMGGIAGATIGGLMSEDDPVGGAALGGLAGALGTRALRGMKNLPYPEGEEGLSLYDRLTNYQRFALLANPENLAVNFAAPTTSSALASIERMLAGGLERTGLSPVTDNLDLGRAGLGAVLHPKRVGNIPEDARDAVRLISEAERADLAQGGASPTTWDRAMRIPADVLTTGDIGARKALESAGWSESMARVATVTSNPRYEWLGGWIDKIGKQGAGRFLLPFRRTAANVLEGSLERTPVVGIFMHMTQQDPELKASMAEIAAQQGMGGLVSVTSYLMGANIDPETAREAKWPLYITNLSGQYGALAAAAFAAGQASQRDDAVGSQVRAAGYSMTQDMPLPTAEPASGIINAGSHYLDGEPPNPQAESAVQRWLPSMLTPRFLRDQYLEPLTESFSYDGLEALGL